MATVAHRSARTTASSRTPLRTRFGATERLPMRPPNDAVFSRDPKAGKPAFPGGLGGRHFGLLPSQLISAHAWLAEFSRPKSRYKALRTDSLIAANADRVTVFLLKLDIGVKVPEGRAASIPIKRLKIGHGASARTFVADSAVRVDEVHGIRTDFGMKDSQKDRRRVQ